MIPKEYRLCIKPGVKFLGEVRRGQIALVIIGPPTGLRWATSISKRVDKRAVARNRLRRQINQWLYQHKDFLPDVNMLLILNRRPGRIEEVFTDLGRLLKLSL